MLTIGTHVRLKRELDQLSAQQVADAAARRYPGVTDRALARRLGFVLRRAWGIHRCAQAQLKAVDTGATRPRCRCGWHVDPAMTTTTEVP